MLNKKVYMYMCPIPNGFRDRSISLYSTKTVDKKEILRTVFNKICVVGGGIKVHSTLRSLNGLLCQPRVIMIMEKSVE
jgi:hypothetical protein